MTDGQCWGSKPQGVFSAFSVLLRIWHWYMPYSSALGKAYKCTKSSLSFSAGKQSTNTLQQQQKDTHITRDVHLTHSAHKQLTTKGIPRQSLLTQPQHGPVPSTGLEQPAQPRGFCWWQSQTAPAVLCSHADAKPLCWKHSEPTQSFACRASCLPNSGT